MAAADVDTVREVYDVFDADIDRLLGHCADDVEWVSPADSIEPGTRQGHDGVRAAYEATANAWDQPTHTPEDLITVGACVVATVTFRGHGRGSGMDAERREYHVWAIEDGVVRRFAWFYDRAAALEQALAS